MLPRLLARFTFHSEPRSPFFSLLLPPVFFSPERQLSIAIVPIGSRFLFSVLCSVPEPAGAHCGGNYYYRVLTRSSSFSHYLRAELPRHSLFVTRRRIYLFTFVLNYKLFFFFYI